jgi:cytidine deaminase
MSNKPQLRYKHYAYPPDHDRSFRIAQPKNHLGQEILKIGFKSNHKTERYRDDYYLEVNQNKLIITDRDGKIVPKHIAHDILTTDKIIDPDLRTKMFNYILATKRLHTIGDDSGWRGAAIAISEQGEAYIGVNTVTQDGYFKDCAETNAVNAMASDADIYPHNKKSHAKPQPELPKLSAVYVMGGREKGTTGPDDKGLSISCPCGKCTDMLSNIMPDNAMVYTLPIPQNSTLREVEFLDHQKISTIDDLRNYNANRSGASRGWATPIHYLAKNQHVTLEDKTALKTQAHRLRKKLSVSPHDIELLGPELAPETLRSQYQQPSNIVLSIAHEHDTLQVNADAKDGSAIPQEKLSLVAKTVENILRNRESIPELDIANNLDEASKFKAINRFLTTRIEETIANRVAAAYAEDAQKNMHNYSRTDDALRDIGPVSCVVIQLTDGTFYTGTKAVSAWDKSGPNAEVNALSAAMKKLATESVKDVWVMEYDPQNIENGILRTSPKEGVERILKRLKNGSSLDFHFIPFNDGSEQSAKIAQSLTQHMSPEDLLPSKFTGSGRGYEFGRGTTGR